MRQVRVKMERHVQKQSQPQVRGIGNQPQCSARSSKGAGYG